jgi:trk system potassium uptake protein
MKRIVNFEVIFRAFGISITIIGLFMLTSIPFALYFNENTIISILLSSCISIIVGQMFIHFTKTKQTEIGVRDAFIIVTFTWFMLGVFGSLPYIFSGAIPNITDAYFETISGFTTTGASILIDIESLPKSLLYWRGLTQWLGGMGILVLVIAIIPTIGYGGVKLFIAEAPGPSSNKIHPKIQKTALKLWLVYSLLTGILVLLLYIAGMNFYESVCHALTTLSTGGFSPKNSSIAQYAPSIQIIITIFMFLGGVNFVLHYYLFSGKFKKYFSNKELQSFFLFIVIFSIFISIILYAYGNYSDFWTGMRHSFFQSVSIITTTGFASADYVTWPQPVWLLILLLFFTGGMIGSTAGGVKFTRYLVLFRNIRVEIKKLLHPSLIISVRFDKKNISDEIIKNFFIVFIAYMFFFCLGSISLSLFLDDPIEAMSVSISCLGAIGPAFGQFGPAGNYAMLHDVGKWIGSFLMVIGRLEVLPILMFLHFAFWK